MIEAVNPLINPSNIWSALPALSAGAPQKVSEEFLTIFYKEILKQMVKTPDLSLGSEDSNTTFSSFNSDLMVEQLAKQLAKDQAKNLSWLAKGKVNAE